MINIDVSSIAEYIQYCEKLGMKNYWFRGVSKVEYKTLPNIVWRGLRKQESALEHEFLSSYKFYINNHHLDSWEILSLMQHHGLPTRLLDWSESPLVALFFALTSEPDSDDDRVVWVLNPNRLNFLTTGHPNLLCPTNIKLKHIAFVEDQNKHYNIDAYLPPNLKPQEVFNEYPRMPIAIMTTNILKRVSAQKGRFTIHGSEDKALMNTSQKKTMDFK